MICKHGMKPEWCHFCLGGSPSDYNPSKAQCNFTYTAPYSKGSDDKFPINRASGDVYREDYGRRPGELFGGYTVGYTPGG